MSRPVLSSKQVLRKLAHLYGVQIAYYDVLQRRRSASTRTLLAVLQSLGAPVITLNDVSSAWRERQQQMWRQTMPPVVVARDGEPPVIDLRLPHGIADSDVVGHLFLENGQLLSRKWKGFDLPIMETAEVEGIRYAVKRLTLSSELPIGYHRFVLQLPEACPETLVIVAPPKAYIPVTETEERVWGLFLPLHALHSRKSWGIGDFGDLDALVAWVAKSEGRVVGTLPLLTSSEGAANPSPYMPSSRLLWNELYLDMAAIEGPSGNNSTDSMLASPEFQKELKMVRSMPLVDYRRLMTLKRRVLEKLCRPWCNEASNLEALERFAQERPVVDDYARFRAAIEKHGARWRLWPQPLRGGVLGDGDYDEALRRYYLYVQWLTHQQVDTLSRRARERGVWLYLDLPVGVHPDGYDAWREGSVFVADAEAGSPPDIVFTKGQNWSFPPLHPERIREEGYRYFVAYIRHHMQHAGILRIDHMMSFHRLFWIPKGLEASQGAYVRYPSEEMYAIAALESHRNKTIVVGEDLGTVSPEVRPDMSRHGLHRMYIIHYELESDRPQLLPRITPSHIASLNTHDMPPFAAFWRALDIPERLKLGLLDKSAARIACEKRRSLQRRLIAFLREKGWIRSDAVDARTLLSACLAFLSASRARVVLVNLEDLWLETKPQNVPTTQEEYPNWRRKARYSLEKFSQMAGVIDTLRMVNYLRKKRR